MISQKEWILIRSRPLYRVTQQDSDLGWVYFDFGSSAVCLILLGLMRDGQIGQSSWARLVEHPNQSNPAHIRDLL